MPVPSVGLAAPLQAYLADVEARLARLETPAGPVPGFSLASTDLTTINAAQNGNRSVWCSDLKVFAFSTGAHWHRTDTGAQIV